jgi:hypothetical protein
VQVSVSSEESTLNTGSDEREAISNTGSGAANESKPVNDNRIITVVVCLLASDKDTHVFAKTPFEKPFMDGAFSPSHLSGLNTLAS